MIETITILKFGSIQVACPFRMFILQIPTFDHHLSSLG